ncbi:MAG: exonuclease domain-containing protein [Chloroflexi bacterium]|nr:exonuclease domain-containing protein [Chloroflexota bacterium]
MHGDLLAFDLETTGLNPATDEIIEIGVARFRDGEVLDQFQSLVKPSIPIPADITHLTGIHQEDVEDQPTIDDLLPGIETYFADSPVIAHNAGFDLSFMQKHGVLRSNWAIDTLDLAAIVLPAAPRYGLGALAAQEGIELANAHRALDDAVATGHLYWRLWKRLCQLPPNVLSEIIRASAGKSWLLREVFQAALGESLKSNVQQRPTAPFAAERLDARPLDLEDAGHDTLPLEAITDVLGPGGRLAEDFADYESRDEQLAMAREVAQALNDGGQVMIEAGTGTGKSLAYLIPAALWAMQNGQRVTISTQTINLQEQLLKKDIPQVRRAVGSDLQAALMKGRGNYLCPRRLETLRRRGPANLEELKTLAKILVWLQGCDSGDRGEITLRGGEWSVWARLSAQDEGCSLFRCASEMEGVCPFYRARQRAETAHLLITNHALLIADARIENRALPTYHNLIVDEAHHLEDAITNGLSRQIDQQHILARLRDLGDSKTGLLGEFLGAARGHFPPGAIEPLEIFVSHIADAVDEMRSFVRLYFRALHEFAVKQKAANRYAMRVTDSQRDGGSFTGVLNAWRQLGPYLLAVADAMERLCKALPRYEQYNLPDFSDYSSEIRGHWRYLAELLEQLEQYTQEPAANAVYALTAGERPERLRLHISPLHVGPMMDEYLNQRLESIVLTSATLQTHGNFEHIKERLYTDSYRAVGLGSPFDYQTSTLVYIPQDIPAPNQRSGYQKMIERGIIELAAALNGRVMVLFTSYAQLREVSKAITPRLTLGDIRVYDQSFGTSRDLLLESFKKAERAVLMGTRSFWEGVDIPGDDLSAVVIAKLPFAVPSDPIFAARSETYANSFQEYAVPDAILRFRQGFGRLIRRRSDRGVVAIFDSRVISKNYGASFLESLPDCTIQFGTVDKLPIIASSWIDQS